MNQQDLRFRFRRIFSWRNGFFLLAASGIMIASIEANLVGRLAARFYKQKFPWQSVSPELLDKMVGESIRGLGEPRRRDLLVPATGRKSNIEEAIRRQLTPDPPYAMPYGCLAYGLAHANRVTPSSETVTALRVIANKLCDDAGNLKLSTPLLVEHALAGWLLLELSEIDSEPRYLKAAGQLAKLYVSDCPKSADGTLSYIRGHQEELLVDSVGLLCPFLVRCGITLNDESVTNLGILQLTTFLERGCDPQSGIPWYAYITTKEGGFGASDWARGSGWLALGLAEAVTYLPADHPARSKLIAHWKKLTPNLVAQQRNDGLWGWALHIPSAAPDTSGSAMIALSIQKGINMKILPERYAESVRKAERAIVRFTNEDGIVTQALYDCQGIGHYPAAFGPSPYAQAFALAVVSEAIAEERAK